MFDLQQRIDDLRRQIQRLPDTPDTNALNDLERAARTLLTDAKNTPHEAAAQTLFAELAQRSSPSAGTPNASQVRALVRRARIRVEIGGEDNIDGAIDILAEAMAINAADNEVSDLLRDIARQGGQAQQRVADLFKRYGMTPPEAAPPPPPPTDIRRTTGAYNTSQGYPPPERELYNEPPTRRTTGSMPAYSSDVDEMLSDLTQAYYAGDYQQVIDLANRILSQQPGNPTALEYRQKAEDNLIRGVVPDHRIPFDARVAYNRANSLVRAGNYDEAERLYREARDLAERNGIMSWKDAEQAMLDIQDLALARELLNEGDRLMTTDFWAEALRKYEGALAVVPNDPQTEERIDKVRRVQADADQVSVQLNMLSGTMADQVTHLQNILTMTARLRQLLPGSQRLQQLNETANQKLNALKTQIGAQAQAAMMRASNANSLEERLTLTSDAQQLLELGMKLDPGDGELSQTLMEARAGTSDMQRARQVLERAGNLIAQNFDDELIQSRSMLTGLRDYAQDARYRTVVGDLLTRYVERAAAALDQGDIDEAQQWLEGIHDEPFNVLGRRTEVVRLENGLRALRQRRQMRLAAGGIGMVILLGLATLFSRPVWEPIVNPPPTPTASNTPTPSDTPTSTSTSTPSTTPTWTITPSVTVTPSFTPTETVTPTHTPTPTITPTPSDTPTITPTPTPTSTLVVQCRIYNAGGDGIFIRSRANTGSTQLGVLPAGTAADVQGIERNETNQVWYRIVATVDGASVQGWVRSDLVRQLGDPPCPALD